ncbi:TonB-dependent receptor [Robertkochia marina]|uniref:TonB-dependent receptor n=1 Tax=Robertkochia marina TaxID=1227945 RepID=A0A4V3UXW2_9FLAO|nr:TonB-dependent receptor [Robertkochia marina]THD65840.1 TonB-dependent receptor [Robertkochia marina]TRZ41343.1 TonB-dependent receptor [Robertkochia marina]
MRSKAFKFLVLFLISTSVFSQVEVKGRITDAENGEPLPFVEVYDKARGLLTSSDAEGYYSFTTTKTELTLIFLSYAHEIKEEVLLLDGQDKELNILLETLTVALTEVEVTARRKRVFELSRLKDVEGTAIYAGKKTEVVLVDQSMANLATNNARQIYSKVAGLNIYQNDDAGLQLNIGGRGLDPNRTSNFNTRQNGYDISADVLGYPESYYSPAAEGIEEIQVVRGAASLQYGTQFGGLVNFKMKQPVADKPLEVITRNTTGSYGLYTNFTSVSGSADKWHYYTFFNYKTGDGFRPNSEFESKNVYAYLGYDLSEKTTLSGEVTYLRYLAKQGGGLTDLMFEQDPFQSNRSRNWFEVDWFLYNLKLDHAISENTNFTFNFFGLDASRYALGFRTNRVDQVDPGTERDLIQGDFKNYGFESRFLSNYTLLDRKATFLTGIKFYNADNFQKQGPGSDGTGPDFRFYEDDFPNYPQQSQFDLPNLNLAWFGEHIFYLSDQFSVTPGFRLEYIRTKSEGFFKRINTDAAGNVIFEETVEDNRDFERDFLLLGVGFSYKPSRLFEAYANISQNYRSVTFSDININNPAFAVSPDITDERGYTVDVGLRGNYKGVLSYDLSTFAMFYNDRIGFVQKALSDGRVISERGNVGDAVMLGLESLFETDLAKLSGWGGDYSWSYFLNLAMIRSEYTRSEQPGIEGNQVEFVPDVNLKTGMQFGYRNLRANVQYTYLSRQFTDATNSVAANISGVIGEIPAYDILDVSLSYTYRFLKLETGVNNLLDNIYFTRRATGYPGPGIIPSAPRNWYVSFQVKL